MTVLLSFREAATSVSSKFTLGDHIDCVNSSKYVARIYLSISQHIKDEEDDFGEDYEDP